MLDHCTQQHRSDEEVFGAHSKAIIRPVPSGAHTGQKGYVPAVQICEDMAGRCQEIVTQFRLSRRAIKRGPSGFQDRSRQETIRIAIFNSVKDRLKSPPW